MAVASFAHLLALKDLEIVVDLGRETSTPMPMVGLLVSLHRLVVGQGNMEGGMAGVIRLYTEGPLAPEPADGDGHA